MLRLPILIHLEPGHFAPGDLPVGGLNSSLMGGLPNKLSEH